MGASEPSEIDIVVTTDADSDPASVAPRLRDAGMRVGETLAAAGVVTGSAAPDRLGALRDVDGVLAVEAGREIHLPPPGEPQ